jgi:hypothetical protein
VALSGCAMKSLQNVRDMAKSERRFHKQFELQQRRKAEQKKREQHEPPTKIDNGKDRGES